VDTDRLTSPRPRVPAVGTTAHSRTVAHQADLLVNRLLAIKAMGTLRAELQALEGLVPPVSRQAQSG
jgi:hypothetical protein